MPRIPATYPSLDEDAFFEGAPYSSHILDSMSQAHNHMMYSEHQMFSAAWRNRVRNYGVGGAGSQGSYEASVGQQWQLLVPPLRVRKRPGATLADFRVGGYMRSGECRVQVVTLGRPFRKAPDADLPGSAVFSSGSSEELAIDDVPLIKGETELVELWGTVADPGAATTDYLNGSDADGLIIGTGGDHFIVGSTDGTSLAWETIDTYNGGGIGWGTAGDFAVSGFTFEVYATGDITDPPTRRYPIRGVEEGGDSNQFRRVYVGAIDEALRGQISQAAQTDTPFAGQVMVGARVVLEFFAASARDEFEPQYLPGA